MWQLDELINMKNWNTKDDYGPYGYSGMVYDWCGNTSPIDLAEDAIAEFEKIAHALELAVMVLCETRGHARNRPCQFCRDMMIPK